MSEAPFWIVWNPRGPTPPKTTYPTRKAAQYAAREMARKISFGEIFYVMKAQSAHQQQTGMCDFIIVPWGIGAPCPYHPQAEPVRA